MSNGNNPWGGGGNGGNPWGNRSGGGAPGGAPDLDEMLRRSQERLKRAMPGGGQGPKGALVFIVIAALIMIGLQGLAQGHFFGFYRVNDGEVAVVQRFGAYVRQEQPGLRFLMPMVEEYTPVSLTRINRIELGTDPTTSVAQSSARRGNTAQPEDMMMLTGDANVVDLEFTVQWRVSDPVQYLFNMRDPETTLKVAAASVMREIMGQKEIMQAIGVGREDIRIDVEKRLRDLMASYNTGIMIDGIQLQRMEAPGPVQEAFIKAQSAQQEANRLSNVAEGYRNSILPAARADANRMLEEARAYKSSTVADAQGDAARFTKVYDAYKGAQATTASRMYLETMEQVLGSSNKVLLEGGTGSNKAVPYLPLNQLVPLPKAAGSGASAQ